MRTARELLDGFALELFEHGGGTLTIDMIEQRQREFEEVYREARVGTVQADLSHTMAHHLRIVGQAMRFEAFRL